MQRPQAGVSGSALCGQWVWRIETRCEATNRGRLHVVVPHEDELVRNAQHAGRDAHTHAEGTVIVHVQLRKCHVRCRTAGRPHRGRRRQPLGQSLEARAEDGNHSERHRESLFECRAPTQKQRIRICANSPSPRTLCTCPLQGRGAAEASPARPALRRPPTWTSAAASTRTPSPAFIHAAGRTTLGAEGGCRGCRV